jgi:hypothetical protein
MLPFFRLRTWKKQTKKKEKKEEEASDRSMSVVASIAMTMTMTHLLTKTHRVLPKGLGQIWKRCAEVFSLTVSSAKSLKRLRMKILRTTQIVVCIS